MSDTDYYFGHGEAWLGTRTSAGAVSSFDIPLPEIDELSFSIATEKVEHMSKRASIASKDLSIVKSVALNGKIVCSVSTADLLKMYLYGNKLTIAGGSFIASAAIFPSGIAVGDILPIPGGRKNITGLSIVDSTGSPVTLTLGTHYEITDAAAGLVKFLDVTSNSVAQPFKAAGTEGAGTGVQLLTQRVYERYLRFKGINIADNDKSVIVDLYKCQIEPAKDWTLLNSGNEVNKYEIGFECLKDTNIVGTSVLSQYGNYKETAG